MTTTAVVLLLDRGTGLLHSVWRCWPEPEFNLPNLAFDKSNNRSGSMDLSTCSSTPTKCECWMTRW
jgi:hypothetical protein